MFLTLCFKDAPADPGGKGSGRPWSELVDQGRVLEYVQRLVENRHSHFDLDTMLVGSEEGLGSLETDDDWCPAGVEPRWPAAVVDAVYSDAAAAAALVRQLPPDVAEMIAGNYLEESGWLLLSGAGAAGGSVVRRLLFLFAECF